MDQYDYRGERERIELNDADRRREQDRIEVNQASSPDRDRTDEEFAQEVAPAPTMGVNNRERGERKDARDQTQGRGLGIFAIILSILSFFMLPFIMAPAGIIIGVIAARRGTGLGWWAAALGIIALILSTLILPFRILF